MDKKNLTAAAILFFAFFDVQLFAIGDRMINIVTPNSRATTATEEGHLILRIRFGKNLRGVDSDPNSFKASRQVGATFVQIDPAEFENVVLDGKVIGKFTRFGDEQNEDWLPVDGKTPNVFKFEVRSTDGLTIYRRLLSVTVRQQNGNLPTANFQVSAKVNGQVTNSVWDAALKEVSAAEGMQLIFDAGASLPAGGASIKRYCWDFGDGSGYSGLNSAKIRWHAYEKHGEYIVTLCVKDNMGAVSAKSSVTVRVGPVSKNQ